MVDREVFARYVQQVLARLDDRAYLATHPLLDLLVQPPSGGNAEALRQLMIDAIDQLRPPEGTAHDAIAWRIYRQMHLRHLEGRSLHEATRILTISKRQAERDHARALRAIEAVLWARWARQRADTGYPASDAAAASYTAPTQEADRDIVEEELLRLGNSVPKGPTDVGQVIKEAMMTVDRLAQSRGASFRLHMADGTPPVAVNRVALRQAVLNLLTYLSEVGAGSMVDIQVRVSSETVDLKAVADHRQTGLLASTPSVEAHASLAVARRLVEMQGGHLLAADAGSVLLRLPVATVHTVLVIDDNPDLGRLFRRYLRSHPYRVVQATNGPSALQLARELRPAIITLDVLMPAEDGWEILRQLKSDPAFSAIPIIVCSVMPERSLALSLGVVDFLPKPVTEQHLVTALERWLPER